MKIKSIELQNLHAPDQIEGFGSTGYGSTDVVLTGQAGEKVTLKNCPIFVGTNNFFTGDRCIDNLAPVAWVCDSRDQWGLDEVVIEKWESQTAAIENADDFDLPGDRHDTINEAVEAILDREPEIKEAKAVVMREEIDRLTKEEED